MFAVSLSRGHPGGRALWLIRVVLAANPPDAFLHRLLLLGLHPNCPSHALLLKFVHSAKCIRTVPGDYHVARPLQAGGHVIQLEPLLKLRLTFLHGAYPARVAAGDINRVRMLCLPPASRVSIVII